MTPPRGPHKERTEQTTAALVHAARELFAADGYRATSLDAVCAAAGVTKGALYHHFPAGKSALFAAVFAAEKRQLARQEWAAYDAEADPWAGFRAACLAFLRASVDPGVQRITLLDSAGALGETALQEAEAASTAMLRSGLTAAMEAGCLPSRSAETLAQLLHGMLCRAALVVARSDEPDALQDVVREVDALLDGLAS